MPKLYWHHDVQHLKMFPRMQLPQWQVQQPNQNSQAGESASQAHQEPVQRQHLSGA